MDGVFDHDDPNNRPEEIPMDDLGNDDEYFDTYDHPYEETTFTSGGGEIPIEMVDDKGRPIENLANNPEYQRLQRERKLLKKANTLKSAILDVQRVNWNADIGSLNTWGRLYERWIALSTG